MSDFISPLRFTLRQLQYFDAVARTGQISLAATEMHVTQSTVTSAIAELERALDAPLLERHRSGVVLTYAGHLFLQQAQTVLAAAHDAARQPFKALQELEGEVRIAASYTVLGYFLVPLIAKFQKNYPKVQVIPVELDRQQIEQAVLANEVEMAVVITSNLQERKRFHEIGLVQSPRQLWVAQGHPLEGQTQVSLEQVAQYPYILISIDEGEVNAVRYWQAAGINPSTFIKTSSMEAVREMVALNFGVTILSNMVYRPWSLEGKRIHAIRLPASVPPMEVGLITSKEHALSSVAERFAAYLSMSAKQMS